MSGGVLGAGILVLILILVWRRVQTQKQAKNSLDVQTTPVKQPLAMVEYSEEPPTTPSPGKKRFSPIKRSPKMVKCPAETPETLSENMEVFAQNGEHFDEAVVVGEKQSTPASPGGTGLDKIWIVRFTKGDLEGREVGRKHHRLRTVKMVPAGDDEAAAQSSKHLNEDALHPTSSGCLESCFWMTFGAGVSSEERYRMYRAGQLSSGDALLDVRLDGKVRTGMSFCYDFVFFFQQEDTLLGMFCAYRDHPYTRRERKFVWLSMTFFSLFLATGMNPPSDCGAFLHKHTKLNAKH